jgi:hypothetical protein
VRRFIDELGSKEEGQIFQLKQLLAEQQTGIYQVPRIHTLYTHYVLLRAQYFGGMFDLGRSCRWKDRRANGRQTTPLPRLSAQNIWVPLPCC